MKQSRPVLLGVSLVAACALAGPLAGPASAAKGKKGGVRVTVRVEGMRSTLLPATTVDAHAMTVDPDGKPADTCSGATAAAALQQATGGKWTAGAYYSGLGYPVIGLFGESYPFTSAYYWSFWVDGKVASAGICGTALHPGERLLFFPQCSKESAAECPQGLFDPPVLELKGSGRARAGKAITLKVLSLDNLSGKPSPGAGVRLTAAGRTVMTATSGTARLRFAKAGRYRIVASEPGAIRDELIVTVRR
jgi:hypothetical protein